ncbi:hypothetical protein [Propionivibrio sp.]|uniref:hypothetical protein n=1 Tax=Propionivibrio sp. TaxID=2212460 RepID=UPI0025E843C4|nr:hypothetical protein [Propionivibrio sp.]MBK7356304.1 hypothetical protein [Propionivibrio sp.]
MEELDKLLGSLSRYSRGPKEKALIIAAKDTLAAIHPDVYKRVSEPVKCPHCGTENQILIGEQPPASASPTCSTCKQSFHAHRGKDLKVFAVVPGHKTQSTGGVGKVTIKCGCGEKFDAQPNVLRAIRKACLNCGQGFFVEADGSVKKLPDKQIVEYEYDRRNVNEKSVYCVDHHSLGRRFAVARLECYLDTVQRALTLLSMCVYPTKMTTLLRLDGNAQPIIPPDAAR